LREGLAKEGQQLVGVPTLEFPPGLGKTMTTMLEMTKLGKGKIVVGDSG
jgi:hypothetical protein